MYVVILYVEGGPRDAETFACGPFTTETIAAEEAERLAALGESDYHCLYATAAAVEYVL